MSTPDTLKRMLKDLSSHHRSKVELLPQYIQMRLDKSVQSYYEDLLRTSAALERKDAQRVLREMVRGGSHV